MKGLGAQRTTEAIGRFVQAYGSASPRRALFCTYELDPERFEALLLPELSRRGKWFRTLVLADAAALQKAGVLSRRAMASRYELAPVRIEGGGVFHPKIVLVQAGGSALVGVGSANLTAGGLGGNLEFMLFASQGTADGASLAASCRGFLRDLLSAPRLRLPRSARELLQRLTLSGPVSRGGALIHNLHEPLLKQMDAARPRAVTSVAVISPWHSAVAGQDGLDAPVIAAVARALGATPVVYTQGEGGKGPALGRRTEVRVLRAREESPAGDGGLDGVDLDGGGSRRLAGLHAKAYLARGAEDSMLWIGSANCTLPALERTAGPGNVEVLACLKIDRRAEARLHEDLDRMFERARGVTGSRPTPRLGGPGGTILSGYVVGRPGAPVLKLELAQLASGQTIWVAASSRPRTWIAVSTTPATWEVTLQEMDTLRVVGEDEVPPQLWERTTGGPVPFPVSVPCVAVGGDAEAVLEDAIADAAGWMPSHVRDGHWRGRGAMHADGGDEGGPGADDTTDKDRMLAVLTATRHQGRLDRLAVLAEMFRRRVARGAQRAAKEHYARLIADCGLDPAIMGVVVSRIYTPGVTP